MFETEIAEVTADSPAETPSATAAERTPTAEEATAVADAAAGALPDGAVAEETKSEETPQPAWAKVTDPYDLFDLPEVKEIQQREIGKLEEQLRGNLTREFEDKHQNWEAENTARTLQSHIGRLQDRFNEGDTTGFEKALERLESFTQPHLERLKTVAFDEGAQASAKDVGAKVRDAFKAGMDRRTSDQFDDLWNKPGVKWEDIFEFREKARIERATTPLKQDLKDARDEIERLKVQIREGKGPPGEGGISGGGRTDRELKLDPSTPVAKLKEIRDREKAAQ